MSTAFGDVSAIRPSQWTVLRTISVHAHTHTYISIYVYIAPSLFVAHFSSEKLAVIILAVFTYLITCSVCNPSPIAHAHLSLMQMPSSTHLGSDLQGAANPSSHPTLPAHVKALTHPSHSPLTRPSAQQAGVHAPV